MINQTSLERIRRAFENLKPQITVTGARVDIRTRRNEDPVTFSLTPTRTIGHGYNR